MGLAWVATCYITHAIGCYGPKSGFADGEGETGALLLSSSLTPPGESFSCSPYGRLAHYLVQSSILCFSF